MIDRILRLLGTIFFSHRDDDKEFDRLQPNGSANQNRYHYNQYDDYGSSRENLPTPSPVQKTESWVSSGSPARSYASPSKNESNATKSNSHPTNTGSGASSSSPLCNPMPKVVLGRRQIKPVFEQTDLKLNIPSSSFPSKAVSSSSPQRSDVVSFGQWKVKSNTTTSSLSTKTVPSSSPHIPDAISLPNNFITKPATAPCIYCDFKKVASVNSLASKSVPAVSPTPKAISSPIYSIKQKNTSPCVPSNAGSNSFKSSGSPKAGSDWSEFRDFKSNLSTNSASSKLGCGLSDIEDPKKVGKGGTQRYEIPKHIEEMIKNDIVPPVLRMPLSPDTYADYFAVLLYAEDFYCEKWSDYLLKDVTIKLCKKENPGLQDQSDKRKAKKDSNSKTQKNYPYVVFEIEEVPEQRPYLLSRDHVHLRPLGKSKDVEPFHGVLCRVEKSTTILAEFKDDFHKQHEPSMKYDVSFSFNRVCLKRAHRAVSAATNPLLRQILFPNPTSLPAQRGQVSLVDRILNNKFAPIPYLIEGSSPSSMNYPIQDIVAKSSSMNYLIQDIVVKIYESRNDSRVLICAPTNSTCDSLMRLIMNRVSKFDLFRANAAFRDIELVPDDIMQASLFHGERFTCPSLEELQNFRIITSTFVSTFRLYNAGLKSGHFSHIFLVDASSAMEPEMIVALADLASEETVVVVTGSATRKPIWVRSDIGRRCGLRKSFFERLLESEPYQSGNPLFITSIRA